MRFKLASNEDTLIERGVCTVQIVIMIQGVGYANILRLFFMCRHYVMDGD